MTPDPTPTTPPAAPEDNAGIYFPPPFVYVGFWLLGLALHRLVGHDAIPADARAATRPAGLVIVALGFLFSFSGIVTFRRARTAIIPHKPATRVVTSGPYRFTRNPMYVGLALVYLGLPLFFGFLWPYPFFPAVVAVIRTRVIAREEAYMERHFGEEFRRYKASVRRWI